MKIDYDSFYDDFRYIWKSDTWIKNKTKNKYEFGLECKKCNQEFLYNKYKKTSFCSDECLRDYKNHLKKLKEEWEYKKLSIDEVRHWIQKNLITEEGTISVGVESAIKKKDMNFYTNIMNLTNFINEEKESKITMTERFYHIMKTDLYFPKCFCGNNIHKFVSFKKGYTKCCCDECSVILGTKNFKETSMKRYGVDNPGKVKKFKDKRKDTYIERYGYDHPCKNPEISLKIKNSHKNRSKEEKENITNKRIQTNLEKYGEEYPIQTEEIKLKTKETNLKRYGVEHTSQLETVREKISNTIKNTSNEDKEKRINIMRDTYTERYGVSHISKSPEFINKRKDTYIKIYGYDHPCKNEEIKNKIILTNIEKYGVKYPCQNPEIAQKTYSGNRKSWHKYMLPSGCEIKIQGYEPIAFDILLEKYTEDDILYKKSDMPEFWYFWDKTGKTHRYYPDFYIPKDNLIIEVKSTWTYEIELERVLLKRSCVLEYGYDFNFMILNAKGEITNGN